MLNAPISKLLTTRMVWTIGLGALVLEVQALRAEMNQAAAASIRAQLLVGRLQMEDQRIAGLVRELEAVQTDLAAIAQGRAESATKLKLLEEAVMGATSDVREEAEKQLAAARAAALQGDHRQQLLKRRENVLAKDLQEDQARWQDINARLENFEQSIPGTR
jgi:chromosome segregation ATPase